MSEILCSTGALIGWHNGRNYRLLNDFTKQLSCDGFEFMMYDSWYSEVENLIDTMHNLNLYIPVMHCEKGIGEKLSKSSELKEACRLFEINCQIANKLNSEKMVIHLWNGRISDTNFPGNLNAYSYLADIAKEYKIALLVENVVCNSDNPLKRWRELTVRYPDIRFVFDTKMAAFHQELDLLYQPEYQWLRPHIFHYHVNDYAGGYKDWDNLRTLPIGKGKIDFTIFFGYIKHIRYNDTFTVEATAFNKDGVVDINMLNEQFDYIRKALKY